MRAKSPRSRRKLERVSTELQQAGLQTQLINEMYGEIARYANDSSFTLVSTDTLLYQFARDRKYYYAWAIGALDYLLETQLEIAEATSRSNVFRIVLIPDLRDMMHDVNLATLRDAITFNLHLHLWHAVVLGVVVLPAGAVTRETLHLVDFTTLPGARRLFQSIRFYDAPGSDLRTLAGAAYDERMRATRAVVDAASSDILWLWYDERNFETPRLRGARWEALRKLFLALEPEPFVCRACTLAGKFHLDHILPIADGHPQTVMNLMGLCAACNRKKSDRIGRFDPFVIPQFVPERYRTAKLKRVMQNRPNWVGRISRPTNSARLRELTLP